MGDGEGVLSIYPTGLERKENIESTYYNEREFEFPIYDHGKPQDSRILLLKQPQAVGNFTLPTLTTCQYSQRSSCTSSNTNTRVEA
ncbi:hypothetical protein BaRGS_00002649 [Batillaria attramentaria]|uniref:Uncharacterized protein n=1 Tax=Batillaria attramentaria TaxID=370345 RepID=A0ABD0M2T7_9CAEN